MKAVAFLPTTTHETKFFIEFLEDVQKRTQGQVKIKFLGGPEVISSVEQVNAVQSGVVQIAMIPPSYYAKRAPAISAKYLVGSIAEQRKNGFYDILGELTEKAEMRFLGEINPNEGMYLFTNFMVNNPHTDFKGKKIRTVETYDRFIEALGAAGVVVPRMDLQKALVETRIEREPKWEPLYDQLDREAIAKLREKGVKEIKFSPDDEKWFVNLALAKEGEDFLKEDPINGERLRKIAFPK